MSNDFSRRNFVVKTGGAALAAASGLISSKANAATPSITLITPSSSPQIIHSWGDNLAYKAKIGGIYAYGTWADGPFNPYRRSSGDVLRAIVPQSENRTLYAIPGTLQYPGFSPLSPMTLQSPRYPDIAAADHSHWIFSVFNLNANEAVGLAHTENYSLTFEDFGLNWTARHRQNQPAYDAYQETYSISLFKTQPRAGGWNALAS